MRMLAGFMIPTAGTARILGCDVQRDGVAARQVLGFLPEGAPTYPEMSVFGFLRFCARVRGFTGSELAGRVERALDLTTLRGVRLRVRGFRGREGGGGGERALALTRVRGVRLEAVQSLSKGFKGGVGLAQALLPDPPVLDEPTDGLDPNQKHEVRGLIERMAP